MKRYVVGSVINGKFVPESAELFKRAFAIFEGKKVEFPISEYEDNRTLAQNRYLWGSVYPELATALKEQGWDVNEDKVHGMMAQMFLEEILFNKSGEEMGKGIKSTSRLTKKEFSHYIEQIAHYMAENLGAVLSPPTVKGLLAEEIK